MPIQIAKSAKRFSIDTETCELLLSLDEGLTLQELACLWRRDVSVISRKIKRIAESTDLLEKIDARWRLTKKGKALNLWTQEAMLKQNHVMNRQGSLTIAGTREFSSRVLLPKTRTLIGDEDLKLSILSTDSGIEELILASKADFGFDCGRPLSPSIAYKRVAKESMVVVASTKFIEQRDAKTFSDLQEKDQLRFSRHNAQIWGLEVHESHYWGHFNDLANLREAAILGYGWAIVPFYAVKKEIEALKLKVISGRKIEAEYFSVWWLRERKEILPWVNRAIAWLTEQNLTF